MCFWISTALRSGKYARYISRALRDRVLVRDGHCCTFVGAEGVRCGERKGLEIDHEIPYGLGGQTVETNLRTVCRAHNQMFARKVFGDLHVDQCIAGGEPVWPHEYLGG